MPKAFDEFVNEIVDVLPEYMLDLDIQDIHINKVMKNNNVELTGMAILVVGQNVSPNMYMEDYYNLHEAGVDTEEICRIIRDDYFDAVAQMNKNNMDVSNIFTDTSRIYMRLVNYEQNAKRLDASPYIRMSDLAIEFRYIVSNDDNGIASAAITYKQLESMNMTKAELYDIAKVNTSKHFPVVIKSLTDTLVNLGMPVEELPPAEIDLLVVTNTQGINGATAMLYPDVLSDVRNTIGDFYILPSSVHEVLILKKDSKMFDVMEMKNMVREINNTVVRPQEILSNEVYEYNERTQEIYISGEDREADREIDI